MAVSDTCTTLEPGIHVRNVGHIKTKSRLGNTVK